MNSNHEQSDYGKGSRYRPYNRKKWDDGWNRAFGKKSKRDPDEAFFSRTRKKRVTLSKKERRTL